MPARHLRATSSPSSSRRNDEGGGDQTGGRRDAGVEEISSGAFMERQGGIAQKQRGGFHVA